MHQAFHEGLRDARELLDLVPERVVVEHGDDLVVGFAGVDHLNPAHNAGGEQDLRARDGSLADDADVERVVVAGGDGPTRPARR